MSHLDAIELAPSTGAVADKFSVGTVGSSSKVSMSREELKERWILNFRHDEVVQRDNFGTATLVESNLNHAPHIAKLVQSPEKITGFVNNVLAARFRVGQNQYEGQYFLNIGLLSVHGHFQELQGSLRLNDDNPQHADLLMSLLELADEDEQNARATEILRECTCVMRNAAPVVHEYADY